MLKAFLERRRIKKILGRYVSSEIARQFADGNFTAPDPAHVKRDIEFVFIAISAPDAPSYSERAGIVADIAMEHEGVVHSLIPVVIVDFGSVRAAPLGERLRFVSGVQSRFPDIASIVHGSIAASVGSFGSRHRLAFGFWWPGAFDALRQLATLTPGDTHELPIDRST